MSFVEEIKNVFIKKEISKFWIIFLGIFIITILDALSFSIIIPLFNVIFLNKIPSNFLNLKNFELTINIKVIFLILFTFIFYFKNLFIILFNNFFINFLKRITDRIAHSLFSYYLNQEYIFFIKKSSENFLQKINNDVRGLNDFLLSLFNFVVESIFLVALCFLLFFINQKIFFICFLTFSLVLSVYYKLFKKRINSWANIYRKSTGDVQNLIIEGTHGFKDIIMFNLRDSFIKDFDKNFENSTKTLSRINFLNNIQKYWLELTAFSTLILALFYFVFLDLDVSNLIPVFGLFVITLFRLMLSANKIIVSAHGLKFNYPSFKALSDEFRDFKKNNRINSSEKIFFNDSIEFKNVYFSYTNNSYNILDNFSFICRKNDFLVISGDNGSGKTTLLNLIAGLIKPVYGQVLVDKTFDLYSNSNIWFQKLSYVQQNIFLLDNTIKHNITLTLEDQIDYHRFNKIIDCLQLEVFFKNLPDQLNTKVGVNGISLSGGQKQIISLARALYKNSEILILDEATSALDVNMIALVKKLLLSLKGKKTIIMVTHDLNYFSICSNKVIEIKSGTLNILKS
jgi:ABC-type multidrug transport system fused ATPase/permease subunit